MMTRGEVALIVAQKGLDIGVVDSVYFTAVILAHRRVQCGHSAGPESASSLKCPCSRIPVRQSSKGALPEPF